jgi:hypothetical protein
MKSTMFRDIKNLVRLKVNRRVGGTYQFHLQGQRISVARNQRESKRQAVRESITVYLKEIVNEDVNSIKLA